VGRLDASLAGLAKVAAKPRAAVPLDDIDLALLRHLAEHARISQRRLAARLGVSAPTVSERMSRLERSGVIRGYSAQIDWDAVGYGVSVYLSVTAAAGYDTAEIMRSLWEIAEVEDVMIVTGSLDMLAKLRVRDHGHLRTLLMERIWQIPGMQRTETLIGMAEMPPKNFAAGLLDHIDRAATAGQGTVGETTG
jgi:Lrp/AsnC family leucine-responsive transcriptional regulator